MTTIFYTEEGEFMRSSSIGCMAVALLITVSPGYAASLALNAAGISDGFTLTTFVSGYNAQYGPLAQGIAPGGNVITGSLLGNQIYVFHDVDGQTLANAVSSTSYACQAANCNIAMTTAGGQVYGAQLLGGTYLHFASNGSSTPIANLQAANLLSYAGMWGAANGHIISASTQGLVDIDPVAGTYRLIKAGILPDGVSVSPDGTVAYVQSNGGIQSYNIVTGALINSFSTGHSPDGTGVISGGNFDGDVIVNNNDGTVGLLDPTKSNSDPNQFTIIATGGTRGDFVSPDTSNGTLFLSQTDQVARLSCGPKCSFSGPLPTGSPEPGTLALLGAGLTAAFVIRRRTS